MGGKLLRKTNELGAGLCSAVGLPAGAVPGLLCEALLACATWQKPFLRACCVLTWMPLLM